MTYHEWIGDMIGCYDIMGYDWIISSLTFHDSKNDPLRGQSLHSETPVIKSSDSLVFNLRGALDL